MDCWSFGRNAVCVETDDNFGFQSWKMIDNYLQCIDAEVFDHDSPDWQHDFLCLITLNILSGRNSNLNVVLWTMHQMWVDLGILMETKIDNDVHMRDCSSYTVLTLHAKSKHQGGVALFYQTMNTCWWIEGERTHGPNVISCVLVSGNCHWNIVGVYYPPLDDSGNTMNFVNEAIRYRGMDDPYILLGDLNADLDWPQVIHDDKISSQMVCWLLRTLAITSLILTVNGLGHNDAMEITFKVRLLIFWLKNLVISNVGQLRFLILIQINMLSSWRFILVSFIFINAILVVDESFHPSLCSDLYQKMMYNSSIWKTILWPILDFS